MASDPLRTLILTKMGIGVFDPLWWKARLALFDAITAASVSRFIGRRFRWTILLDGDLANAIFDKIVKIIERHGLAEHTNFQFVTSNAYLGSAMRDGVRSYFGPSRRGLVQILDDDDATCPELHDRHLAEIDQAFKHVQVVTTSTGTAIDAPKNVAGTIGLTTFPFNTTFYGNAGQVSSVMRVAHTTWLARAQAAGGRATTIESDRALWLYLYHGQGDGPYEHRSERLRASPDYGPLTAELLTSFGIDADAFHAAIEMSRSVPPTLGLTWRRTQPQQLELSDLKDRATEVKKKLVDINSHLFDDQRPFFYLLSPRPRTSVRAGKITIKGVGLLGSRIEFWLAGKRDPKLYRSTTCDPVTGEWSMQTTLSAATWSASFRQLVGDEIANRIDYRLHVVARDRA